MSLSFQAIISFNSSQASRSLPVCFTLFLHRPLWRRVGHLINLRLLNGLEYRKRTAAIRFLINQLHIIFKLEIQLNLKKTSPLHLFACGLCMSLQLKNKTFFTLAFSYTHQLQIQTADKVHEHPSSLTPFLYA